MIPSQAFKASMELSQRVGAAGLHRPQTPTAATADMVNTAAAFGMHGTFFADVKAAETLASDIGPGVRWIGTAK
jgi:hypothetical protein